MKYAYDKRLNLHVPGRISPEDAARQRVTATEILARYDGQPGVVLADEVGMGKTFVALAVAASVALANPEAGPVVVMVPPSLKEKWPRDFALFHERCVPDQLKDRLRAGSAERGVEFLKLLDDPPDRRRSIVFLTHGAMYRGLSDNWVQLAIIQRAFHGRHNVGDIKRALYRDAGELLGLSWVQRRDPDIWQKLLSKPPERWLSVLQRSGIDPENDDNPDTDDDPVPALVVDALQGLDFSSVLDQLKTELPRRHSKHHKIRIRDFRRVLRAEMKELWTICVRKMKYTLPLLILDEAHHLKNPDTQLASLFQDKSAAQDADELSRGPFAGVFHRMLFLTATPFQLGHHELCSVLNRFAGVSWAGKDSPHGGKDRYRHQTRELLASLDKAQAAAMCFERAWGRLSKNLLHYDEIGQSVDEWWETATEGQNGSEPTVANAVRRYQQAKEAMNASQELLAPWVIRHNKDRTIRKDGQAIARREYRTGEAILTGDSSINEKGIAVGIDSLMPFLVASRLTTCMPDDRPVFAEGLASSYEAFLHTRAAKETRVVDGDDDDAAMSVSINDKGTWYLQQLERIIPQGDPKASRQHPKIDAVVSKVVELWEHREKVLVFSHYIATGRILRQHISDAIRESIVGSGARLLGAERAEVMTELGRLGERFFDTDSPARRACDESVLEALQPYTALRDYRAEIVDVVRKYVRTPSFLVRYFPLDGGTINAEVFEAAMSTQDESGMSFRVMLQSFFEFLSSRCTTVERANYIAALGSIQTGTITGHDVTASFDETEQQDAGIGTREQLLPNVRLVNGATKSETRQRLMLTFNTPFFPEVLVASSVMAEGVDLHLNCRYVLHHDLCWNPSTLEQRNGRVDRIGSKAEQCFAPIHIYLPYVGETQDEKMYHVVRDRERWFKVVMGEKISLDAKSTDRIADRLPLPESVVEELQFDLRVWSPRKTIET